MKAWKIDLRSYDFTAKVRDEETGAINEKTLPFNVKDSLASILFHPELRLNVIDSFKAQDLANKIRKSGDDVLVDTAEMDMIKRSYNVIKAPQEYELEFFKRIRDAEEVEVEEIKKEVIDA